jgi:hypothetical protein
MCKHTLNPLSQSLLIARPRLIMMLGITTSSQYTKDGASSACRDIRDIQIVYTPAFPLDISIVAFPFDISMQQLDICVRAVSSSDVRTEPL